MIPSVFVFLCSTFHISFAAKLATSSKFAVKPAIASNSEINLTGGCPCQPNHSVKNDNTDPFADFDDFLYSWDDPKHEDLELDDDFYTCSEPEPVPEIEEEFYYVGEDELEENRFETEVPNQTTTGRTDVHRADEKKVSAADDPYKGSFYGSYGSDSSDDEYAGVPMVHEARNYSFDHSYHGPDSLLDSGSSTDRESVPSPLTDDDSFSSIDFFSTNSGKTTPVNTSAPRQSGLTLLLRDSVNSTPAFDDDESASLSPKRDESRRFKIEGAPVLSSALFNRHG